MISFVSPTELKMIYIRLLLSVTAFQIVASLPVDLKSKYSNLFCLPLTGPVSFVKHFSYKDIKKATDNFCRVIYRSSDRAAYTARFQDGGLALVKEIKRFEQRKDAFYKEVQLLGRLHHRHLLALIGFSIDHKRFGLLD